MVNIFFLAIVYQLLLVPREGSRLMQHIDNGSMPPAGAHSLHSHDEVNPRSAVPHQSVLCQSEKKAPNLADKFRTGLERLVRVVQYLVLT